MMKKNAVIIGSFSPPHMGHLYMIDSALALTEKLTILIYSYDNKEYNFINGQTRYFWLSEIYKNYSNVTIKLIEDIMPQTPESHGDFIEFYEIWTNDMISRVEGNIDLVCGSEEYVEDLATFLNCDFKIIDLDRKVIPIHGTDIRKSPLKNWKNIHPICRPFFSKKIVILGGESCGKSTMTRLLSRIFNSPFVEEYGREYVEGLKRMIDYNDFVWDTDDFTHIARTQLIHESEATLHNNQSKFLFCDTDIMTTQCFHQLYLNHKSNVIQKMIEQQEFADLYFLLSPEVQFINDGTREFENKRDIQFELLENELKVNNCNYMIIKGSSYEERLTTVVNKIKELFL